MTTDLGKKPAVPSMVPAQPIEMIGRTWGRDGSVSGFLFTEVEGGRCWDGRLLTLLTQSSESMELRVVDRRIRCDLDVI